MSTKTIDNSKTPGANKSSTEGDANGERGEPNDAAEVKIVEEKPIDPTLLPIGDPAGAA